MKKSKGSLILILVAVIALGTVALLNLPSIQERLEWRVSELVARVLYFSTRTSGFRSRRHANRGNSVHNPYTHAASFCGH